MSLSLERALGRNNALNGNRHSVEQTLLGNKPFKIVTSPWLETAPGWKQPLAGNSPWLETAPGRRQPLAENSLQLETTHFWKPSSK